MLEQRKRMITSGCLIYRALIKSPIGICLDNFLIFHEEVDFLDFFAYTSRRVHLAFSITYFSNIDLFEVNVNICVFCYT